MIKIWKTALVLTMSLCLLFTTACGSDSAQGKGTAKGRYLETMLNLPEKGDIRRLLARSDQSLDVYYTDLENNNAPSLYHSEDGSKWTKKELSWKLPEDESFSNIAYGKDDTPYLLINKKIGGTSKPKVYQVEKDGDLAEIPLTLPSNGVSDMEVISDIKVTENGRLFLCRGDKITGYTMEGQEICSVTGTDQIQDSQFAVTKDKLYLIDANKNVIDEFDTSTGKLLTEIPAEELTDLSMANVFAASDGSIYVYNDKGVFRRTETGTLWEKVIDGGLNSLSMPSLYFYNMIMNVSKDEKNSTIYFLCGSMSGDREYKLAKYTYDPDVATVPDKELTVYSLSDSMILRQAAGEFQRKYPDTMINIQVAMSGDDGTTKEDAIRTLNTELFAKKGPDVLLLDGLPISDYIDKGVLLDLSPVLKETKAEENMIQPVIHSFQRDGKIWAVPVKFCVPILYTDEEGLSTVKDLQGLAQFAKDHPDKPLIGDISAEHLLNTFLPANAASLIKGDKIDEKEMTEFLEALRTIATTGATSTEVDFDRNKKWMEAIEKGRKDSLAIQYAAEQKESLRRLGDLFQWAYDRSHAYIQMTKGFNSSMDSVLASGRKAGEKAILLPGQISDVFYPTNIIGINGNSKEQKSAKAFVELLFSKDLQSTDFYDGFPVRKDSMDKLAAYENENISFGMRSPFNDTDSLMSGIPTAKQNQAVLKLVEKVKNPAVLDDALRTILVQEAKGYINGEKSLEQTMADIKEKAKLYLSK